MLSMLLAGAGVVILALLLDRIGKLERRLRLLEDQQRLPPHAEPETRESELPAPVAVEEASSLPIEEAPAAIAHSALADEPIEARPADEFSAAAAAREPRWTRSISFEDLFGRKLPIWIGGIALAIAGMLIVRYSIELGLLSPAVRVAGGLLFGFLLIAAAEVALRTQRWIGDERVRQALAGAGIATLYASILVAANVYGIIAPLPAFVAMAVITALAMFLSLRFGVPSALLGLVGGLAAPALVGSPEPNVPLLSLYLALVVGGLCAVSRSRQWEWLGAASLAGGFIWGGLLLASGELEPTAAVAVGLYLLLLGIVLPAATVAGKGRYLLRTGGSLIAAGQMAVLVASGGFALLHWGLFGLLSVAIIWLSRREQRLVLLPPLGLVIALLLAAAWPDPTIGPFVLVASVAAAIYGGAALQRLWGADGDFIDAAQIAFYLIGMFLIALLHFHAGDPARDAEFALLAAGFAVVPSLLATSRVHRSRWIDDGSFVLLVSTAALLLAAAAFLGLPGWSIAPAVAAIALGLLALSITTGDRRIEWSAWAAAASSVLLLVIGSVELTLNGPFSAEVARMFGVGAPVEPARAVLRWAAVAGVFACLAWRARFANGRIAAQGAAAMLAYGAAAQLVDTTLLPLVPAVSLVALGSLSARLPPNRLLPSLSVLAVVSLCWALHPFAEWAAGALISVAGDPLLADEVPALRDALLRLLLPSLALAAALVQSRDRIPAPAQRTALVGAAVLATVAIHSLFKQLFALGSLEDFVRIGLAERLVWEAILLAGAAAAWRQARNMAMLRTAAVLLWASSMLHLFWYGLLLHNPLLSAQEVGAMPLLNLLLPLYGLAAIGLRLAAVRDAHQGELVKRALAIGLMLLILLFAFSELRQLFHGSLLVGPGLSASEDILRSVLAIGLAIGFLSNGIVGRERDWRIASLLLMLAAVAKVFLFDAAGLEGLLRILSFVALGFSLIGIGWLYSRFLPDAGAGSPR